MRESSHTSTEGTVQLGQMLSTLFRLRSANCRPRMSQHADQKKMSALRHLNGRDKSGHDGLLWAVVVTQVMGHPIGYLCYHCIGTAEGRQPRFSSLRTRSLCLML
jgi:hypothetical protein